MVTNDDYHEELKSLGSKIRNIRCKENITQYDFLQLVQIRQNRISEIENGKQNVEFNTLAKIAYVLNVPLLAFWLNSYSANLNFVVQKPFLQYLRDEKQEFGERLSILILNRCITQHSLGMLSHIDPAKISSYVNGNHNITLLNVLKMSDALKYNLATFFDYRGAIPENTDFELLTPRKRNPKKENNTVP